jgi:hypothetical protein
MRVDKVTRSENGNKEEKIKPGIKSQGRKKTNSISPVVKNTACVSFWPFTIRREKVPRARNPSLLPPPLAMGHYKQAAVHPPHVHQPYSHRTQTQIETKAQELPQHHPAPSHHPNAV